MKGLLLVFLKGCAMGAADVVPGVSGGTIAFITGIYQRLVTAISRVDLQLLGLLRRAQWRCAWQYLDATFLLVLVAGISTSLFSLAHVISWLLDHYPLLVWSFFVGLVLASALMLALAIKPWRPLLVALLLAGVVLALLVNQLRPLTISEPSLLYVFGCGMVAICAMLLPGVSGSFLLVVFGIYAATLAAIKHLDLSYIAVFATGAGLGMLGFAKLLAWAMRTLRLQVLAVLTGFLLGSVSLIWPWKAPLAASSGLLRNVWPQHYATLTGEPAALPTCLGLMLFGAVLVLVLERLGKI